MMILHYYYTTITVMILIFAIIKTLMTVFANIICVKWLLLIVFVITNNISTKTDSMFIWCWIKCYFVWKHMLNEISEWTGHSPHNVKLEFEVGMTRGIYWIINQRNSTQQKNFITPIEQKLLRFCGFVLKTSKKL